MATYAMISRCIRSPFKPSAVAVDVATNGFAYRKGWEPDKSSEAIADAVGLKLIFNTTPAVHQVVPKAIAGRNKYSGIFGLGAFPFHTDMAHWRAPPHYLMLRCVKGYSSVTTDLVDGSAIVENVGRSIMSKALVKPRRPLNGSTPLYSLFRPATPDRDAMLRWDEVFIVPASRGGQQGCAQVTNEIASAPRISISLESPGDTLWIDNWRMLHGRSAVSADQGDRVIQRVYFGELH